MTENTQLAQVAEDVGKAGCTVADLCREAGIARSTWDRWVAGRNSPNMKTLDRVLAARDTLLARGEGNTSQDDAA